MADTIYDVFKTDLMDGTVNVSGVSGDTLKVALLTSTYTISSAHTTYASLTNEVSGTGYTAGGVVLANQAVTGTTTATFNADDAVWSSADFTARYAALYSVTNSDSLICVFDFLADKTVTSGTFTIQWNASGIITLT